MMAFVGAPLVTSVDGLLGGSRLGRFFSPKHNVVASSLSLVTNIFRSGNHPVEGSSAVGISV